MELTIDQALQQGITAHKEGKLQDAEKLYRAILQSQPNHPDANHNLGVLAAGLGKVEAALPYFKTALEANPKVEQFWLSYINALIKEKQFEGARQVIGQAQQQGIDGEKLNALTTQLPSISEKSMPPSVSPSGEMLNTLLTLYQSGSYNEAEKHALSLTKVFPDHPLSWKVLGVIFQQTGRINEALSACEKTVQLTPQDAEAYNNLGVTLQDLGRLREAESSFRQSITSRAGFFQAHYNLGNTLKELGRFDEAKESYRTTLALNMDYTLAHFNLAVTFKELGKFEDREWKRGRSDKDPAREFYDRYQKVADMYRPKYDDEDEE